MRTRPILLIALLLVGAPGLAASTTKPVTAPQPAIPAQQQITPAPPQLLPQQPAPESDQQNRQKDERGTETFPLVVKTITLPKSQGELDRDDKKENSKLALDTKLTDFTGNLAIYTFYLVVATSGLFAATFLLSIATGWMVRVGFLQLRDTKSIIDSAKRSADAAERALVDLERAYIFFGEVTENGLEYDREKNSVSAGKALKYSVVNYGRTPAILTEYFVADILVTRSLDERTITMPLPVNPMMNPGRPLPVASAVGQGQKPEFKYLDIILNMNRIAFSMINGPKVHIFFMGYIRYIDIFGQRHRMGFCVMYDDDTAKFSAIGGMEYNYTCDESKDGDRLTSAHDN